MSLESIVDSGKETKKSEREQILAEHMRETFDPGNYSTLGHGTSREAAIAITKTGLESKTGRLDETAVPLFDTSNPYEEQDEAFHKLLNWPHRSARAVVVVMIPNPGKGQGGGSRYFDSVFEKRSDGDRESEGHEYERRYVIPPQFIKGYVDAVSLDFVPNPHYDAHAEIIVKQQPLTPHFHTRAATSPELTRRTASIENTESDDVW